MLWNRVWRAGRAGADGAWAKVPYQVNGAKAKSNDPATWDTFGAVRTAYESGQHDGIGFMLGNGFVGVDLDNAIDPEKRELYPWAAAIGLSLDTYCEISPSATGVKLFGRGKWNRRRNKWEVGDGQGGEIEVYGEKRVFVVTGMGAGEVASGERFQAALDALATSAPAGKAPTQATGAVNTGEVVDGPDPTDEELIRKARAARNGDKFARLFDGDIAGYGSQSEADLALCGLLAFWCGRDAARLDRLFRSSKLWRPKWDEPRGDSTYGMQTIAMAIDGCAEVYTGEWDKTAEGAEDDAVDEAAVGDAGDEVAEGDAPDEADDDPHRLAWLFLQSLAPAGEPPRLRHWLGDWWEWRDGVCRPLPEGDLRARLQTWVRNEFERLWRDERDRWAAAGGKGSPPVVRKVGNKLMADVAAALRAIANLSADLAPPAWLDGATGADRADLIVFPNGLLEAANRRLHPATASYFALNALGCPYEPDAPAPVAFERFLTDVLPDAEAVEVVWEWLGLLMTSDTRFHKLLFLLGRRRAGKSTLVKVIVVLVGPGNSAAVTLTGLAETFGLSPLIGKSLATVSEARITARSDTALAVSRLLAITGEDAVQINRKNRDILTVRLRTRFVVVGNELPDLPDAAGALTSRMIVLPFLKAFEGHEDRGLADRLLAELPGIAVKALGWRATSRNRRRPRSRQIITEEGKGVSVSRCFPVRSMRRGPTARKGRGKRRAQGAIGGALEKCDAPRHRDTSPLRVDPQSRPRPVAGNQDRSGQNGRRRTVSAARSRHPWRQLGRQTETRPRPAGGAFGCRPHRHHTGASP